MMDSDYSYRAADSRAYSHQSSGAAIAAPPGGMGVVFCCAQPHGRDAPTFEWTILDGPQRLSCRRVVQRIMARIETTAFGERRQYVNDMNNVVLLSIVGDRRTLFVVGCMRRDMMMDQHPIAAELDRLLVQVKRAYSQHIQGAIAVGATGRIENDTSKGNANSGPTAINNASTSSKRSADAHDDSSSAATFFQQLDREAIADFNQAVQHLMDCSSQRLIDIVSVRAAVRSSHLHQLGGAGRTSALGRGGGRGLSLNPFGGGGGNEAERAAAAADRASCAATEGSYGSPRIAAGYAVGAGGAVENPFLDDVNDADAMHAGLLDGTGPGDEESGGCCSVCCSVRARFVLCFMLLFVGATVVFVLLFACKRKDGEGRTFISCGS